MQQKTLRFILIGGALFVWGTIMLKVFAALGEDKAIVLSSMETAETPTLANEADTFSLLKGYADPFLPDSLVFTEDSLAMDTAIHTSVPVSTAATTAQPIPEVVDLSFIKYLGMIANPDKKLKAAIVSIKGKDMILKEEAVAADVTIKKITADQLAVVYKGKKYTITR